jgi:hypothetical protein
MSVNDPLEDVSQKVRLVPAAKYPYAFYYESYEKGLAHHRHLVDMGRILTRNIFEGAAMLNKRTEKHIWCCTLEEYLETESNELGDICP